MQAIDTYDVSKGPLGQWAWKPIQKEVLRAVRNADHQTLSIVDFTKRPKVLKAVSSTEEDSQPSIQAIAKSTDSSVAQVTRIINAPVLDSISHPVGDDGNMTLGDSIAASDPDLEDSVIASMEYAAVEEYGLPNLNTIEHFVLVRRFGLDGEPEHHLSDLGQFLGMSREAVRKVQEKALAKLLHPSILAKILDY